jgi:hypothetical protein
LYITTSRLYSPQYLAMFSVLSCKKVVSVLLQFASIYMHTFCIYLYKGDEIIKLLN